MSVDSVAQGRPEDGVKGNKDLVSLNDAPVKHPSPGALAKCDTCSMDVPVSMLHSRGTNDEHDIKTCVEAINAAAAAKKAAAAK